MSDDRPHFHHNLSTNRPNKATSNIDEQTNSCWNSNHSNLKSTGRYAPVDNTTRSKEKIMPRRKGAKKAKPAVEVEEIDAYADVEGFGSGDPNAVAEAAAAAAVAAEAAAAAAAGHDPDEAILEAAARSAVAEAASDGKFL